jgi:RNA polymerase sigma factor (sigma-70 family)
MNFYTGSLSIDKEFSSVVEIKCMAASRHKLNNFHNNYFVLNPVLKRITLALKPNAMEEIFNIDALKTGDEDAFRAVVEAYQDRVFNTCFGFLASREEAEDAAQETFIEVYSSINNFREEAKLWTWIYRIAVNKSLQIIRNKKRKKRFAIFYKDKPEEDIFESLSIPDENNHPLFQIENKERSEALYAAMNKLPESQRTAFVLHKIEGLSYDEVSKILNVTMSSVESLMHRAKDNLKKHLYSYYKHY